MCLKIVQSDILVDDLPKAGKCVHILEPDAGAVYPIGLNAIKAVTSEEISLQSPL